MKTVVLQTYTGKGFLQHANVTRPSSPEINKQIMGLCMKSVREWCNKNKYTYKLLRELDLGWDYAAKHSTLRSTDIYDGKSPLPTNDKDLCAQRHEIASKIDTDYLIIIDNDIFIKDDFDLPDVKVGLCIHPWGQFLTPDRKNYRVSDRFDILLKYITLHTLREEFSL